jgi:aryl-alcohol dehydrogenase-like predicted oxidoreductase
VNRFALGCSGMSGTYGPADEADGIATIRAAIDAGVMFVDTADFYGMGHNEWLIRQALRPGDRERIALSVKFGVLRGLGGGAPLVDGRPAAVASYLAWSLQRLGTDHVDVYRPARLDPQVPVEDTVGAIAELVAAGYVRRIGLSEVGPETIRRAHAVHPIADVQVEYSLFSRGVERPGGVLDTCRELGIGITAYGVLSHGLLSGHWRPSATDPRAHLPRFHGANAETNLALVERLGTVAAQRGATVAQLAIAWVLSRGTDVVAVVGSRTTERLAEALPAADLVLDAAGLAAIEEAVPAGAVAGERYAPAQFAQLDSEH